jgi:TRAP-type C4-dicarboxylate transport system permease small subunit
MGLMHFFSKAEGGIHSVSRKANWFAIVVIMTAMMLLITLDVILRYVLNSPLAWGQEVTGYMLMAIIFMSIGYCWIEKGHIRMELVYERVSGRGRAILDVLAPLVGLFFWGALAYQGWLDVQSAIDLNETGSETGLPVWPFRLVMTHGLILFVLALVGSLLSSMVRFIHPQKER